MKDKKQEQGVCPFCGSISLDYSDKLNYEGNFAWAKVTCFSCREKFNENYELTFVGHESYEEDYDDDDDEDW